jgi:hypothetical protein
MADNITAKIQVRRGELDDLPTLAEGEFGYALDHRRLFIGNTPVTFTADGVTSVFTIQDRSIIPTHLKVLLNDTPLEPFINYQIAGTDIVFAESDVPGKAENDYNGQELARVREEQGQPSLTLEEAAEQGLLVPLEMPVLTVSFNTELVTSNVINNTIRVPLDANVTEEKDTGVSFSLVNYNTAFFDYSLKTSTGAFKVGTLKLITDGDICHVDESSTGVYGYIPIQFNGRVDGNRLHLTYINTDPHPANFYYSVKLWNTI